MWWYALPISLVVGYGLVMLWSSSHHARLKALRKDFTIETFRNELMDRSHESEAIEAAYKDLAENRGYPPHPQDDLKKTLGFLPEEFEDMVEERCRQLGIPDVLKSSYVSLLSVYSVEDYVHFLSQVIRGVREKRAHE